MIAEMVATGTGRRIVQIKGDYHMGKLREAAETEKNGSFGGYGLAGGSDGGLARFSLNEDSVAQTGATSIGTTDESADRELQGVELGGPDNRKDDLAPLPVNNDLLVMATRLAAEQARVAAGANSCCLAVCAPDSNSGRFVEHSVAEIADRFSRCLRSYDSVHHFGRDRIVICLPHLKSAEAPSVLLRMRELVTRYPFFLPNGSSALITATLGGVMMDASTPVHETINRADRAKDMSRLSGNNRVLMWSPDMF
ncbi:MAG: diguanylate cyclase [Proteobacteria bacterium]|nr:diguanylate cyclase [Pseudomonadota bacterium]